MDENERHMIVGLLQAGSLTQSKIARMFGCHSYKISLIAKTLGLRPGRGKKPWTQWHFRNLTPALAYLLGFYLTDGALSLRTGQIHWCSTTPVLIQAAKAAAIQIGFRPRVRNYPRGPDRLDMQVVAIYSTDFSNWLHSVCAHKSRIPGELAGEDVFVRLAFLAGVIDGDGRVRKDGSIEVRGTKGFVSELPGFLQAMGIRSSVRQESTLPSGKPYLSVSIRRSDFVDADGWCHHPEKQRRILEGRETRKRVQKRRYFPCPVCGFARMTNRDSLSCRACYMASDRFHDHLRRIAPAGNLAANRARWGHSHSDS